MRPAAQGTNQGGARTVPAEGVAKAPYWPSSKTHVGEEDREMRATCKDYAGQGGGGIPIRAPSEFRRRGRALLTDEAQAACKTSFIPRALPLWLPPLSALLPSPPVPEQLRRKQLRTSLEIRSKEYATQERACACSHPVRADRALIIVTAGHAGVHRARHVRACDGAWGAARRRGHRGRSVPRQSMGGKSN